MINLMRWNNILLKGIDYNFWNGRLSICTINVYSVILSLAQFFVNTKDQ